jgi:two-component system NarL family sensor kinase
LQFVELTAQEDEGVSSKLSVSDLHFSRLLDLGDRVIISAERTEPGASAALREVSEMLGLEARMLRNFTRLQTAERKIAGYARTKGGGRSTSLRLLEMDRRRTARELHTGVGQVLAAIRLQLEIVAHYWPNPPDPVREALAHIGELADHALQHVRSVSQRLHPPEWQRLSLPAALEQLWKVSGISQKFEGSLRIEDVPAEPGLEIKVLLYRAAQEGLSNLIRHSQASRLDAVLQRRGDRLVLSLEDDGVGFDTATLETDPPSLTSGIGLRSIAELSAGLGGELTIQSTPAGTKLVVSVPYYPMDR